MSPPTLSLTLLLLLAAFLIPFLYILRDTMSRPKHHKTTRPRRRLPPGPLSLPIIGNLHLLGTLPHRSLHKLSKTHGDIMSLRLGSVPTIVVSSSRAAELFLKTHDSVFANRPRMQAAELMSYGAKGIAFTKHGPYWREMRKLCTMRLVNAAQVKRFGGMRMEEVGALVEWVKRAAAAREVVDVSERTREVVERMTYRMVLGRNGENEVDLKPLIDEALRLGGAFDLSDYVPLLRPFDLQGLGRRMKAVSNAMDTILEKIIDEHQQNHTSQMSSYDQNQTQQQGTPFIDIMLSLMNGSQEYAIDHTNIKAIILDMIVGAFGTSGAIIEWTFSQLLKNPRAMKLVQHELDRVVGTNRMVEETDLPHLNYLEMVLKEVLRLHPVAPLLVPHESMEDAEIEDFYIPNKSRIIVNAWAIGRDLEVWSDNAEQFLPERFANSSVDYRGHDFELIPFGSGRRGCPGMNIGMAAVRIVLAQLLHCFDWELADGMVASELDMSETFGLSMPKATHLLVVPTNRLLSYKKN